MIDVRGVIYDEQFDCGMEGCRPVEAAKKPAPVVELRIGEGTKLCETCLRTVASCNCQPAPCLDCGSTHTGSCCNTNEAKEKPAPVREPELTLEKLRDRGMPIVQSDLADILCRIEKLEAAVNQLKECGK